MVAGGLGFLGRLGAADPYSDVASMHQRGPLLASPFGAIVVGHAAASAVLRDPDRFSSEPGPGGPLTQLVSGMGRSGPVGRSMLSSDPPDHERLRGVVAKAFTPRSVAALEPRVREVALELLAPIRDGEPYDLIERLAVPLPVIVIAELLGIPIEDRDRFKRWSDDLLGLNGAAAGGRQDRARASVEELGEYFLKVIAERRRDPRDDLISRLVAANEGGILTIPELVRQCILLLVAGNETTTHLIGNAVHTLATHPVERARLENDPSLLANAVEETLRFNGVVVGTARVATGDTEIDGRAVKARQILLVFLAGANRDPSVFEQPEVFDVGRANASQNLGFGGGIHYCLGASLARQETRIALETLMHLAPLWRLARPEEDVSYTLFLRGPKRLELLAS